MAAKTTKKQRDGRREDCLFESTLTIWLEIGGTKREEEKGEEKERAQQKKPRKQRNARTGFGVEINDAWVSIETLTTRQVYDKLIKQRMKRKKGYTPSEAHKNVHKIQNRLTARERDY